MAKNIYLVKSEHTKQHHSNIPTPCYTCFRSLLLFSKNDLHTAAVHSIKLNCMSSTRNPHALPEPTALTTSVGRCPDTLEPLETMVIHLHQIAQTASSSWRQNTPSPQSCIRLYDLFDRRPPRIEKLSKASRPRDESPIYVLLRGSRGTADCSRQASLSV